MTSAPSGISTSVFVPTCLIRPPSTRITGSFDTPPLPSISAPALIAFIGNLLRSAHRARQVHRRFSETLVLSRVVRQETGGGAVRAGPRSGGIGAAKLLEDAGEAAVVSAVDKPGAGAGFRFERQRFERRFQAFPLQSVRE